MATRPLVLGDEETIRSFLAKHADTSMFLRSNLRTAGLVDEGAPYQGTWCGAFADGDDPPLVAVAVHGWNGIVLVQANAGEREALGEAAFRAVEATAARGRTVRGIIGPYDQVTATRTALGLAERKAELENKEFLYALDLAKLVIPPGVVHVRPTLATDLDLCAAWRVDYCQEAMGMTRGEAESRARADVERTHARGDSFVLADQAGTLVSYSAFNARVEDAVQVGGVWTPKEERGHGYGRAVVAGSLVLARALGVTRAVLFTGEWNTPAQKAYEAIGFERIGDFGLITFPAE